MREKIKARDLELLQTWHVSYLMSGLCASFLKSYSASNGNSFSIHLHTKSFVETTRSCSTYLGLGLITPLPLV